MHKRSTKRTLNVRLSEPVYEGLKHASGLAGVTMSAYIREALLLRIAYELGAAATAAAYGTDNPEHHAQIRAEVVAAVKEQLAAWGDS